MFYLGWCKINCSFALLKFAIWYWKIFLTKSGYVMHPFNTFGSGTANERTVQWWFEKFCRGDESLEVEERGAGRWKLTVANWEHPSNQILLQLHKKLPENSKPTILQLSGIWTKLERWKSSVTGCPLNWLEKKKTQKLLFWSIGFSYSMQQQRIISWSHCDLWGTVGCIRQPVTSSWVVGPSSSSRARPRVKLASEKRSCSLLGGLLWVWSTTAFWIQVKPLHLRSTLSKSMRGPENCIACSQHWPTERAQVSTTAPHCTLYNQCFKSWKNWATKFCLTHHIHWPLANHHH